MEIKIIFIFTRDWWQPKHHNLDNISTADIILHNLKYNSVKRIAVKIRK